MTTASPSLAQVRHAVENAVALRRIQRLAPAGGPTDKVFPATYEGGKYARESRRIEGRNVECVLLDSVPSQANRMEWALLRAWDAGRLALPVVAVDFRDTGLSGVQRITSLDAPHRLVDAILRDSVVPNAGSTKKPSQFTSWLGEQGFQGTTIAHATVLFEFCPTALIFGMWDSTGARGGSGLKVPRALTSEIVGVDAVFGVKTTSRIDPLQIQKQAGPLYEAPDGGWVLDRDAAAKDPKGNPKLLGKDGKPSEANHGNVTPSAVDASGGVTIAYAQQTTVLSLPAIRRIGFGTTEPRCDIAGRTALVALGLAAATLGDVDGHDLRSRCLLVPTDPAPWEVVAADGTVTERWTLDPGATAALVDQAVKDATDAKLPAWPKRQGDEPGSLVLRPSAKLVELVKRSQKLAATSAEAVG